MILLDTNVVSEVAKPRPNAGVIAWLDAQTAASLFLCAPVLAELHYGVERLPPDARQERLREWVEASRTTFISVGYCPSMRLPLLHSGAWR
ncbi:MAG: PIN domain-containing protein [Rhodoplanes sp.]